MAPVWSRPTSYHTPPLVCHAVWFVCLSGGSDSLPAHADQITKHCQLAALPNTLLVVHPASSSDGWGKCDAWLTSRLVAASPAPDEGMAMRVPVGGGSEDSGLDLLPGLEAPPFEGK